MLDAHEPALRVADRLGDYTITRRLGAGGMATLFLAERTGAAGFALPVAIKVIHPELAEDPAFVRMFVEEALLSARIRHPNVVRVEQLGQTDDGGYFLVMEYIDGCSLAQLLRAVARTQRRLAPELAVAIAIQIADGLHAAHETVGANGEPLGVVHRDVSPQNVLLANTGHAKLIDFGVAKARGRERTQTGHLRGKLAYMAPEQARRGPVDRRADVYALGVVAWEMLAMRRMLDAPDELALLEQLRDPRPVPPGRFAPDVSPALDAAVMSALAVDPAARAPTALAFRQALAAAEPRAAALESSHLADLLAALALRVDGAGRDARTPRVARVEGATLNLLTRPAAAPTPASFDAVTPAPSARPRPRPRRALALWAASTLLVAAAGSLATWAAVRAPRPLPPRVAAIARDRAAPAPIAPPLPSPTPAALPPPAALPATPTPAHAARAHPHAASARHATAPAHGGVPIAEHFRY